MYMTLNGGVIIIGSLLWDEKRKSWRNERLSENEKISVYLPIRYGRQSESRHNTYTMVFSNACYSKQYGLGTGWIIPIKTKIHTFIDLETEARKMGIAEGLKHEFY